MTNIEKKLETRFSNYLALVAHRDKALRYVAARVFGVLVAGIFIGAIIQSAVL